MHLSHDPDDRRLEQRTQLDRLKARRPQAKKRKSKATIFTGKKFRWLEQVAADGKLPPLALRLCIRLCPCFNLDYDGAAWPAQETLAATLGARREAINRTVSILVACGHLESTRRGRDKSNVYRMVLKAAAAQPQKEAPAREAPARPPRCAQKRTSSAAKMCDQDVRFSTLRCDQDRTLSSSKTPVLSKESTKEIERDELLTHSFDHPCAGVGAKAPPAPVVEESKQEIIPPRVPTLNQERAWRDLRVLWAARPYPDDLHAAKQAFDTACREVAPEEIIHGARMWVAAYEAGTAGDGVQFLPKLVNWLTGCCWEKQPPKRGRRQRIKRRSYFQRGQLSAGYVEDENGNLRHPDGEEGSPFWNGAAS